MKNLFQAILLATIPFTFIGCEKDYDLLADKRSHDELVEEGLFTSRNVYNLELEANISVKKPDGTLTRLINSSVNIDSDIEIELKSRLGEKVVTTTEVVSISETLDTDEKGRVVFVYQILTEGDKSLSGISTKDLKISGEHGGAFYQTSISLGDSLWSRVTDYTKMIYQYDPVISRTSNIGIGELTTKIVLNKEIILEGLGDHSLYLPKVNNLRRALGKRPGLILNNGISFSPVREI